jgi:hypothetical protein
LFSGWDTTAPPAATVIQSLDEPMPILARLLNKPPPTLTSTMVEPVPEMRTRPVSAFHSVDDVPLYAASKFSELAMAVMITGLCITQHLFPMGFYSAYMAIVLVCIVFLMYVSLFRPIPPRRHRVSDGALVDPLPPLSYARDMGITSLVLLVAGIGLYAIGDATGRLDTIPHSVWHVLMGLAFIFAVEAVTAYVDS